MSSNVHGETFSVNTAEGRIMQKKHWREVTLSNIPYNLLLIILLCIVSPPHPQLDWKHKTEIFIYFVHWCISGSRTVPETWQAFNEYLLVRLFTWQKVKKKQNMKEWRRRRRCRDENIWNWTRRLQLQFFELFNSQEHKKVIVFQIEHKI